MAAHAAVHPCLLLDCNPSPACFRQCMAFWPCSLHCRGYELVFLLSPGRALSFSRAALSGRPLCARLAVILNTLCGGFNPG
eukprot:13498243-Alexandrium_andersonii.AAC.2